MICDHNATRSSLVAFCAVTTIIGVQVFPDGEVQLMGNCKACDSTLAVSIEMPRGHVVRGEIEADAKARAVPGQDVVAGAVPEAVTVETTPAGRKFFGEEETAEQHANRIIR